MAYRHACVINPDGYYKTPVLVENDVIQYYTLQDGETLIGADVPMWTLHRRSCRKKS